MRRDWDEARLREAFRALSESDAVGEGDVDTVKVWQAVAGELGPEERREVIERVALEPGYAEAWRLATELFEASGGARQNHPSPMAGSPARRVSPLRSPYSWAAAAVILVGFLGVIVSRGLAPPEPVYRGAVINPLQGTDERLPRDDFRLRWEAPEGARFDIRVTTEDLEILAAATDLSSPEYLVPAERLQGLARGARVLFQVDARLPDGSVVRSETFIAEVE